jgi:hypothetical protein
MAANYVLLEKITVGAAGASSVTFSGIPQTGYTDLVVKTSARETNNSGVMLVKINGTTTGYTARELVGSGTAASCDTNYVTANGFGPEGSLAWSGVIANTFASNDYYFPNYTSANYKSISIDAVNENNASAVYMALGAYLWSNTAAITTLAFQPYNSTAFVQYSTFYLYGVAKLGVTPAIVPYATGGNTIMTDGTYWYHTFISSGTFTPQKSLSCDYLVVAGGGGGGDTDASGGGAGGYRTSIGGSPLSLGTSAVTVTVGAGGAGGTSANGTVGNNSVFSTITSSGGGYGVSYNATGGAGGSGGGAGYGTGIAGAGNAGSYSPVEGYAGGATNVNSGGGGGGSSAVGGVGTYSNRGAGGNGTANSISGTSVTYAGGGGAGTSSSGTTPGAGGTGGGGAGGARNANGTDATSNLGGGGGGGGGGASAGDGGAGGSGIVVVRYAV